MKKGIKDITLDLSSTELVTQTKEQLRLQSDFEAHIEALVTTDVYNGIKALQKITSSTITTDHIAYKSSGMQAVFARIKRYLIDSHIAKNLVCEYSIISSTLDPFNNGKLDCCAFIYGDQSFKDDIEQYYLNSIEKVNNDIGVALYQHPNFLFDIPKDGEKYIVTSHRSTSNDSSYILPPSRLSNESKYKRVKIEATQPSSNSLWVQAFQLSRPYNSMISEANAFYQRKITNPESWLSLRQVQEELHSYCHANISSNRGCESYYISFPIYGAIASNQLSKYKITDPISNGADIPLQGIGACFIYLELNDKYLDNINIELVESITQKLSYEIGNLIRYFSVNYLFNVGLQLRDSALKESIKSAKAAIMSRNMSHNLGSHVMFYIKQKLQSVSKIVNNNVLHNIIPGNLEDINIKTITDKIAANKDVELPFLVGLGRFINYLQERQDYIATVATNYIPARSTISFKDFIYDELKPDLRHKRHHPSGDGTDAGWQPSNLLLDYIAYSEGYSKSDAIEIKFGEFDGLNSHDASAKDDFQALRKFNVAVPGGVIGRQAIFSIVENIIRNAAKHSEHRPDGKLALQLSLVDAEKDFTGNFLTDKFRCMRKEKGSVESGESLVKLYQNHKDTFHILRIKLDMPNKEDDIEALVGKLGEDYVEEDGSMKETSKGLKEMRISAAWLRGHSIDTAIPTTEPPVLAVYSEPYKDYKDKETISYFLCIPKPCKVAFVVEDMAKYTDLNDEIKPFGCQIFEYVEQNEKNQDNKEVVRTFRNQIADYEIVCMDLEEGKGDCILPYISSRYITNSATTKSILDELKGIAKPSKGSDQEGKNNETQYAQIKTAIDSIYEKWFEETYGKVNNKLLIVDDNAYGKHKKQSNNEGNASSTIDKVECLAVGTAEEENCKDAVIYSTHFAGLYKEYTGKKDDNKVKSGYEKLQLGACIEPITGNNSTDRLIRQDEWTTEWKYKHLSAGLARVAVFDERIFGSFITSSKGKYIINRDEIEEKLEEYNKKEPNKYSTEEKELYIKALRAYGITKDDAHNLVKGRTNFDRISERYINMAYNGQVAQKNYERRIWAFDIQADKHSANTIKILGYAAMIDANPDWADENIKKPPIKVATLTIDNGKYEVRLSKDGENIFPDGNSQIFDYITIHQGILDKIYNAFGIKENTEENRKKKHEVTNALHRFFSKPPLSKETKKKHKSTESFLPNFIIHSGRSKPNEKDMPQHQPFVQFAAVDHAVKDCKYTLVELLATAHYEKGGNNN